VFCRGTLPATVVGPRLSDLVQTPAHLLHALAQRRHLDVAPARGERRLRAEFPVDGVEHDLQVAFEAPVARPQHVDGGRPAGRQTAPATTRPAGVGNVSAKFGECLRTSSYPLTLTTTETAGSFGVDKGFAARSSASR